MKYDLLSTIYEVQGTICDFSQILPQSYLVLRHSSIVNNYLNLTITGSVARIFWYATAFLNESQSSG